MLYIPDWERIQQRFIEFWNRENHDRPLISIKAPKDSHLSRTVKAPEKLVDRWLDTEYVINCARENFESTYFGGEAYPLFNPNLGPDIFGAILGCDLEFGNETSWAAHIIEDWDKVQEFKFDPNNKWWKKIKEITEAAVEDSKGDYFVGVTDLHAGLDGLVALRGPEELCIDLFDHPDKVKKANFELLEAFKIVTDELYKSTTRYHKGSSNWMGLWNPGKWYVTSCDFICMISNDMFEEFVLPELLNELEFLDASIFHLDGPGALKHLDSLLAIPKLKGIQWVYGAGQPTAAHWIPLLKKIQDAGKLIHVDVIPEDLETLVNELKPEGVYYNVCNYDLNRRFTQSDAEDLVKKVENSYRRKFF